jgi:hypothetical protein
MRKTVQSYFLLELRVELKTGKDFRKALSAEALEALFDLGYRLKQADPIFERVFRES